MKKALAVSRAYQHVLIGQDVAAYQGVEGAWSHIALRQLFPFAKAQAYSTWNEVVEAVERGDAYCGVLPFENSNAGDVSAVLDLLYAHPGLKVARMCDLPIRQDLLALPGAQLSEIKTVISHQQALAQSGPFLKLHHFATKAGATQRMPPAMWRNRATKPWQLSLPPKQPSCTGCRFWPRA